MAEKKVKVPWRKSDKNPLRKNFVKKQGRSWQVRRKAGATRRTVRY